MFLDAIHRRVIDDPHGIALRTQTRAISNAALWDEMTSLAAWLLRQGLVPGDAVGISIKDEYKHLLASLGAMLAGLPQIALPTHDPSEARTEIARRLRIAAVLAEGPDSILNGFTTLALDFEYRATTDDPGWDFSARPAGDVCLYAASSGTTGKAKIIPLTGAQLLHQSLTAHRLPERAVLYRPASIEFNNSKRHRLYSLASGGTNILLQAAPTDVAEICRRFGVTQLLVSVAQAKRLLDLKESDARLPEQTEIQLRGSPVDDEMRKAITTHITRRLVVGYGATEFGSIASALPEDHAGHPSTVGWPHRGVEMEIVDDDDRRIATGRIGRVRVHGAGMATHYYDDEQATASAFRGGWFYPGDVGHLGSGGDLRFDGRADDMMVLSSINIFPAEIERVAETLHGVKECAAFSIKSAGFGDIPLLAVVNDGSTTANEVLAEARNALGLRAPRRVFFVGSLPRNAEGKVVRSELRRLFEQRNGSRAVA